MKIALFPTILLLIATSAIGYLAFHMANTNDDPNDVIVGIGTAISVFLTLGGVIGVSINDRRHNINMKAWSVVAFIGLVLTNLCFGGFGVSMPYYVIVIALSLVIHLWVIWKLSTIKDV